MIKRYKENEIEKLATILKNDGVISVPTDTVYGLCCITSSAKAFQKLMTIKNRPLTKALPIMCANLEEIKRFAYVGKTEEKIIKAFMPGPITIILKKKQKINNLMGDDIDTIAIRMAPTETLKKLIKAVGRPLFMTSANKSGEEECQTLEEIEKSCPDIDAMLIGNSKWQKASTIVDCTKEKPLIIREGPITIEEINKIYEEAK